MTIREAPTDTLKEWHRLLTEQAAHEHGRQLAMSLRLKIKAIEMTLEERTA